MVVARLQARSSDTRSGLLLCIRLLCEAVSLLRAMMGNTVPYSNGRNLICVMKCWHTHFRSRRTALLSTVACLGTLLHHNGTWNVPRDSVASERRIQVRLYDPRARVLASRNDLLRDHNCFMSDCVFCVSDTGKVCLPLQCAEADRQLRYACKVRPTLRTSSSSASATTEDSWST